MICAGIYDLRNAQRLKEGHRECEPLRGFFAVECAESADGIKAQSGIMVLNEIAPPKNSSKKIAPKKRGCILAAPLHLITLYFDHK